MPLPERPLSASPHSAQPAPMATAPARRRYAWPRRPRGPATTWRRRRTAILWWTATAVLSCVTVVSIQGAAAEAAARQRAWGDTEVVPVVRRPVAAGQVIEAADIERRTMPAGLVPDGAIAGDPVGQAARVALWPGEVVLAERLARAGLRGVAALVPEGARAMAVPRGPGTPPLSVGDRVDLLATFDIPPAEGTGEEPAPLAPTFAVASDATVLHVEDEAVTVAVTVEQSARVAFALAIGTVTLALAGA